MKQQITQADIAIIELLGEFADKEKKNGCVYIHKEQGRVQLLFSKANGICYIKEGRDDIQLYNGEGREHHEKLMTIIGQYHLGSILQWLEKNRNYTKYHFLGIDGSGGLVYQGYDSQEHRAYEEILFKIDITKPPMERSEEKKKELLEFIKKIACKN